MIIIGVIDNISTTTEYGCPCGGIENGHAHKNPSHLGCSQEMTACVCRKKDTLNLPLIINYSSKMEYGCPCGGIKNRPYTQKSIPLGVLGVNSLRTRTQIFFFKLSITGIPFTTQIVCHKTTAWSFQFRVVFFALTR